MQIEGFDTNQITLSDVTINFASAGEGPPLLLLHGYPQTHLIWHRIAPQLACHYRVICPDLRGYGDSGKPEGGADHAGYSKRVMAQDMAELMALLGHEEFYVAGHDRGGRVAHRLVLDHPQRVAKACVMDIMPTEYMFRQTDQAFATGYYHWFFLIQPDGLPERMIGADPGYYLTEKLNRWAAAGAEFDSAVVVDYIRCFSDPATIHASCEDYRAAATIDLVHDRADIHQQIQCPLLVLWGEQGFVARSYDVLKIWRQRAVSVQGAALPCGHFLPEECPDQVYQALREFFN